jgi:hypothetical protein
MDYLCSSIVRLSIVVRQRLCLLFADNVNRTRHTVIIECNTNSISSSLLSNNGRTLSTMSTTCTLTRSISDETRSFHCWLNTYDMHCCMWFTIDREYSRRIWSMIIDETNVDSLVSRLFDDWLTVTMTILCIYRDGRSCFSLQLEIHTCSSRTTTTYKSIDMSCRCLWLVLLSFDVMHHIHRLSIEIFHAIIMQWATLTWWKCVFLSTFDDRKQINRRKVQFNKIHWEHFSRVHNKCQWANLSINININRHRNNNCR